MRPWVFDNLSGIRFQLTQDEETVIRKLALAMDKRTPAPSQDAAFDYVAGAIARKRLGYPFGSLVPSYATSLGSSADRPAALAKFDIGCLVEM